MNGRGYDYNLGRFLSVDPLITSPTNSQSLNPYSYILNNPLSGTDPTGYSPVEEQPKEESFEKDVQVKVKGPGRLSTTVNVTVNVNANGNVTGASGGTTAQQDHAKNYVAGGLSRGAGASGFGAQSDRGNVEAPGVAQQGSGPGLNVNVDLDVAVNEPEFAPEPLREAPRVEEMIVYGKPPTRSSASNPFQGAIENYYRAYARRIAYNAYVADHSRRTALYNSWVRFAEAANDTAAISTLLIGGGPSALNGLNAARTSIQSSAPAWVFVVGVGGEIGTIKGLQTLADFSVSSAKIVATRGALREAAFAEAHHLRITALNRGVSASSRPAPAVSGLSPSASSTAPRWFVPPIPAWNNDE